MKYYLSPNTLSWQRDRTTKTPAFKKLSSWLRVVKRWVISNWILIVIFSCLVAILILPGPLDTLSYHLWPAEGGPNQASFTVSGTTTYPGIVNLNITVTNNDFFAHKYAILALIGSNSDRAWWGPGFYRDNLTAYTDFQKIPDPWYEQAFICTPSLNPGQSFQVTRMIQIDSNPIVKDALVQLHDSNDASKILARDMKLNVINVGD